MNPTQQMVDDFGEAWHARQMSGVPCQPGDKRRAGLTAALKPLEPFLKAAAKHAATDGTDDWNDFLAEWVKLPLDLRRQLEREA